MEGLRGAKSESSDKDGLSSFREQLYCIVLRIKCKMKQSVLMVLLKNQIKCKMKRSVLMVLLKNQIKCKMKFGINLDTRRFLTKIIV